LAASPRVQVLIGTIPDPGVLPHWRGRFPDAGRRRHVSDAIALANGAIVGLADQHPRVTLLDLDEIAARLLSRVDAEGRLVVGGERITLLSNGDEPHHLVLSDGIHAGTVAQGIFANEVLHALNRVLGTSVAPLSDPEILQLAGIRPP
jgi:hypothetical protein